MDQSNQGTQQSSAPKGNGKKTGLAAVAYVVFFIPFLTDSKDDPFVKFHAKQGLVLFLASVIAWFIIMVIPIFGWILSPFLQLATIILAIIGIMTALKGEEKQLPLIGKFADKLKF